AADSCDAVLQWRKPPPRHRCAIFVRRRHAVLQLPSIGTRRASTAPLADGLAATEAAIAGRSAPRFARPRDHDGGACSDRALSEAVGRQGRKMLLHFRHSRHPWRSDGARRAAGMHFPRASERALSLHGPTATRDEALFSSPENPERIVERI